MKYTTSFNTRETPQSEPIPGSGQVANSAGGYSFAVDDWKRLDRFLVIGAEGGSYYTSERKLVRENAEGVLRCLKTDGKRAVARIVEISEAGRAPKNDPAIFALAMAAGLGDDETRRAALEALPRVCRIGTHLMHFVAYCVGTN
jgi:60 kDa SS-A/Ro ribonucleoprotein